MMLVSITQWKFLKINYYLDLNECGSILANNPTMGAKKAINCKCIQRVLFIPIAIIVIISVILVLLVISGSINIQKYSFFRSESEKQAQVQFNNKLQLQVTSINDNLDTVQNFMMKIFKDLKDQKDSTFYLNSELNEQKEKMLKLTSDLRYQKDWNKDNEKTVDNFNNKIDENKNQILSLNNQLKEQKILITKIANKAAISTETTFLNWKLLCGILFVFFSNHFFT
ncbi:uncharacterized protein LOC136081085 isoform X2 [Hydra vulgaris]|uniref:Uncharacterized protein LOC136081085 isoform X2 n=1 Tax=Hydra vulgaris TaxID=6087 RepID=A0ABM4BYX4_HYDVU